MFESRISAGATEKLPCSGVPRGSSETVQAWVQHGQDGGRQQGPDSEITGGTEQHQFQPSVSTVSIALGIVVGLTASVWSRRHRWSFI